MKVKTLACLCALAAIPAFGTEAVTSANTFGVLKVTCSAQKVIIATPWVKCGDATAAVSVSNLVMTAGLANGDAVLVYDAQNNEFKSWVISGGAWVAQIVSQAGGTVTPGDAASAAVERGEAFWFVKASYSEPYDLYLYGQDTDASASSTITAGTSAVPFYSLVASPKVGGLDLSTPSLWTGMTINPDDRIVVPNGASAPTEYSYHDGSGWGTLTVVTTSKGRKVSQWTAGGTIPEGRGFWYVSKGGSGEINW